MVKPSEALAKVTGRLAKKGLTKVKGAVEDLLKPKEGQTESETPQESTEVSETSDFPTDEITFDDPFDVMNELPDLPGLSDSLPISQSTQFLGRNAQQILMDQDPEQHITDRVQENQQQQAQAESESNMENSPSEVGDLEGSAQESTINPTGETSLAETTGEDTLTTGLDLGGEILADIDPITAVFGLILGVASLVGGMEGANSIKNPPVPKIPPMAQSSVQFGF